MSCGKYHYAPCHRCGVTVFTRASHASQVICKSCRMARDYPEEYAEFKSPCAACHWLGACRVIVWTFDPLPCEVESGYKMVVPGARKWRMEINV